VLEETATAAGSAAGSPSPPTGNSLLDAAIRNDMYSKGCICKIKSFKNVFNEMTPAGKPKLFTVYVIEVAPTAPGSSPWTVERRYNEFLQLHTDLKQTSAGRFLRLPGKRYVTLLKRNLEKSFVERRRRDLDAYLSVVLSVKVRCCCRRISFRPLHVRFVYPVHRLQYLQSASPPSQHTSNKHKLCALL
jgi:hypothetical protein